MVRIVDSMVVKDGLFLRLLRAVGLVKVEPNGEIQHSAGADYVPNVGFRSQYDPKASLSVLAAFPWPFACVQAISTDLSKVPLRCYRGKGADAEILDDHPVLDLLGQPSSRVGATLFRRQLYTDMVLTGNAFILVAGNGGTPEALLRLHPARVSIKPLTDGQPNEYQYDGAGYEAISYGYEQVLHIRTPSWSDDPSNLWGTGAVQPLHHDLTTEKATADLTARTAATGQPTGILSPKEEGDRWSKEQIVTLRHAYETQMQSGGSGVLILGGQAQFDKMSFTPREMEFSAVRDFVRASTLAAFGVVPVRVGIESANYATAQSQMQLYWESLQGRATLVDESLTRLARMFDEDITVRHDFSAVEVLQESRTERLDRVSAWSMLGVPVSEAAAYEGFEDLPFTPEDDADTEAPTEAPTDAPTDDEDEAPEVTDEPLAATALNGAQIASLLTILANVAAGAITFDAAMALIGVAFPTIPADQAERILEGAQAIPTEAEEPTDAEVELELRALIYSIEHRAVPRDGALWLAETDEHREVWRNFIDEVHGPTERAYTLAMRRYLRGYAARIAKRMPQVLTQRAVGDNGTVLKVQDDWISQLLATRREGKILANEMKGTVEDAYQRAIDASFRAMPSDLAGDFTYDPARFDKDVEDHLADMVTNVEPGTKTAVKKLVQDQLAEGATITQLQAALMQNHAFSATRALTIARTETTKSVNAGAVKAWEQQATEVGVKVEFKWLAAPDARKSPYGGHAALHNKVRTQDGFWYAGPNKTKGPGQWDGPDDAALNINCRCTFTPRIIR